MLPIQLSLKNPPYWQTDYWCRVNHGPQSIIFSVNLTVITLNPCKDLIFILDLNHTQAECDQCDEWIICFVHVTVLFLIMLLWCKHARAGKTSQWEKILKSWIIIHCFVFRLFLSFFSRLYSYHIKTTMPEVKILPSYACF